MRKTCPIVLPEQNIDHRLTTAIQPIASISPCETQPLFLNQKANAIVKTSANDITNANIVAQSNDTDEDDENARYCFSRTMQPAATTTSDCFSANANMQMPSTSATIADHIDSIECCANDSTTTQLTDLNSFDNETFFLNSILQAQHFYPAPSSHSEIVAIEPNRVDLESDASDCVRATTESNRPRQMGRRSEMRSRIVSITAERNAEGNQVSVGWRRIHRAGNYSTTDSPLLFAAHNRQLWYGECCTGNDVRNPSELLCGRATINVHHRKSSATHHRHTTAGKSMSSVHRVRS